MRRATKLGLVARAVVTAAVHGGVLVAAGLLVVVLGGFGGLVLGGLLVGVLGWAGVTGEAPGVAALAVAVVCAVGPLWVAARDLRGLARQGRQELLARVEPVDVDGRGDGALGEAERRLAAYGAEEVGATDADVRERVQELFREVRGEPGSDDPLSVAERDRLVDSVTRLAAQADVPAPTPGVHPSEAPLCYTVHAEGHVFLVVSRGLLRALGPAELEAVLAHEVAHLANRDHRVMTWATLTLLGAEALYGSRGKGVTVLHPFVLVKLVVLLLVAFAATLFSRGRELAADSAAARLTGNPAALASALERLDDSLEGPPPEDLREHAHTRDALNVLPALDPDSDGGGGLLATHPATERRVERLQELERAQETA